MLIFSLLDLILLVGLSQIEFDLFSVSLSFLLILEIIIQQISYFFNPNFHKNTVHNFFKKINMLYISHNFFNLGIFFYHLENLRFKLCNKHFVDPFQNDFSTHCLYLFNFSKHLHTHTHTEKE